MCIKNETTAKANFLIKKKNIRTCIYMKNNTLFCLQRIQKYSPKTEHLLQYVANNGLTVNPSISVILHASSPSFYNIRAWKYPLANNTPVPIRLTVCYWKFAKFVRFYAVLSYSVLISPSQHQFKIFFRCQLHEDSYIKPNVHTPVQIAPYAKESDFPTSFCVQTHDSKL